VQVGSGGGVPVAVQPGSSAGVDVYVHVSVDELGIGVQLCVVVDWSTVTSIGGSRLPLESKAASLWRS
jgi:hypothetical protein